METGKTIRDYILEEKIGGGGAGEVWRARHGHLDKLVAIKVIHRHLAQDGQFYERFLREAMAIAKFDHPNIVGVHDFFFVDGESYLVMSYIEGESLRDLIDRRERLSVDEAVRISRDVLGALNFAHQKGVIHRDIKPSNILVRPDGSACLVDFGIALVVGQQRVTSFGTTIGTPEYMSPEQIKASRSIDHRTDVYSFGCVLYEMLAGRPPFGSQDVEGLTDYSIMHRHVNEKPAPLRSLNREVDEKTERAVVRALSKEPDQRFGGCEQMALALPRPEGAGVEITGVGVPPTDGASSRNKLLLVLVIVFAVTTAIASYGWIYQAISVNGSADPQFETSELRVQLETARKEVVELGNELRELKEGGDTFRKDLEKARLDKRKAEGSLARLGKVLMETEDELSKCEQDLNRCQR